MRDGLRTVPVGQIADLDGDDMLVYVIQRVGYGFTAAVQPGPFQTFIVSQT